MRHASIISFIQSLYGAKEVPLHAPVFLGKEEAYLRACIDSTFVSSIGEYVTRFEQAVAEYTGAKYAVATVNGTAALHTALRLAGVDAGCEVITQSLTFVATCNAISYLGATPAFVDVEEARYGMDPDSLARFLRTRARREGGRLVDRYSGRRIGAVVPMHTFGHPCRIDEIADICEAYGLPLIEDAAESLGSLYKGRHTGRFGKMGIFSFNGNKIVTAGGGGVLVTDDEALARRARHLTTTAKVPHPYAYIHDEVGYNYRLPNLNAALACAQMESIEKIVANKRETARRYADFFAEIPGVRWVDEPEEARSNMWLNALCFHDPQEAEAFLAQSNAVGVMTRPVWRPMHRLPMYADAPAQALPVTEKAAKRLVNIPSGYRSGA